MVTPTVSRPAASSRMRAPVLSGRVPLSLRYRMQQGRCKCNGAGECACLLPLLFRGRSHSLTHSPGQQVALLQLWSLRCPCVSLPSLWTAWFAHAFHIPSICLSTPTLSRASITCISCSRTGSRRGVCMAAFPCPCLHSDNQIPDSSVRFQSIRESEPRRCLFLVSQGKKSPLEVNSGTFQVT